MTTLLLKDLSCLDQLDRAASRAVRGGVASLTREMPAPCHGGVIPPILIRGGWGEGAPLHPGCGPAPMPSWFDSPPQQEPKVVPL